MKTGKILYVLQMCPHDKAQGESLGRLIADLTLQANHGSKSPHADFMVAARFDTPINLGFAKDMGQAFANVLTFRCPTCATGWPEGCNAMAADVWRHFTAASRAGKYRYSGVMLAEADCTPLSADFLGQIHREWSATDKLVLGCYIGHFPNGKIGDGSEHINGNCVIAPQFGDIYRGFMAQRTTTAWDAAFRRHMVEHGQASRTIYSDYKIGTPENPWRSWEHLNRPVTYFAPHPLEGETVHPVYIHGTKTPIALEEARKRLVSKAVVETT
jgi:hypothetical protein